MSSETYFCAICQKTVPDNHIHNMEEALMFKRSESAARRFQKRKTNKSFKDPYEEEPYLRPSVVKVAKNTEYNHKSSYKDPFAGCSGSLSVGTFQGPTGSGIIGKIAGPLQFNTEETKKLPRMTHRQSYKDVWKDTDHLAMDSLLVDQRREEGKAYKDLEDLENEIFKNRFKDEALIDRIQDTLNLLSREAKYKFKEWKPSKQLIQDIGIYSAIITIFAIGVIILL